MTRIILSGAGGKMGKVICALASETDDVEIVCGFDISKFESSFPIYENPFDFTGDADVIIDFSHPSAFEGLVKYAYERKLPLIMCTTGLSGAQKAALSELSAEIPVFFSANMSLGVNLLTTLARKAASVLYGNFDIEIVERHHNRKIDAPSGTALAIADAINDVIPDEAEYVYDRHAQRRRRSRQEIGIHAVRGGNIVGDHTVIFAGKDEVIELSHHAASKEIFAAGALRAAVFMHNKPAGMYDMDMLIHSETGL